MSWTVALVIAVLLLVVAVVALLAGFVPAAGRLEPVARWGMKGCQIAVLGYVIADVITLLQGHRADEGMTHAGYAIAAVGVPVLLLTRQPVPPDPDDPDPEAKPRPADPPHLAVVAVAALATAVLIVRLQQTW
ncbi:hypothetical protein [Nocardioides alcanivorans]|uniref:hypothetical protein n=1 Tax=Nocardioides alcanivorans TaxID=2897352 RepID=UPI001F491CF2|nr:hypothetical protein [Nocardioides alcanivorans]